MNKPIFIMVCFLLDIRCIYDIVMQKATHEANRFIP